VRRQVDEVLAHACLHLLHLLWSHVLHILYVLHVLHGVLETPHAHAALLLSQRLLVSVLQVCLLLGVSVLHQGGVHWRH
tara:strand:- start:22355 stop:22591 length:237 start_codon:yes stop_codon:yes gene_type:complete